MNGPGKLYITLLIAVLGFLGGFLLWTRGEAVTADAQIRVEMQIDRKAANDQIGAMRQELQETREAAMETRTIVREAQRTGKL